MEKCVSESSQWPKEATLLRESLIKDQNKWQDVLRRLQEFSKQLRVIPDQWGAYRTK